MDGQFDGPGRNPHSKEKSRVKSGEKFQFASLRLYAVQQIPSHSKA